MVIVRRFSDSVPANMARMRLEGLGIPAFVLEATRLYGTCADDVRLMVWEGDADDALKVLSSIEEPTVPTADAFSDARPLEQLEQEVAGPSMIGQFFNAEVRGVKLFMLILWLGLVLYLAACFLRLR
ncbi:MAG: DUF2007 domain-containing protein [Verrucomicrobia bacterium]|nr:DUF2007 domain-containing protein [Verrucomicrobiota bacterium]